MSSTTLVLDACQARNDSGSLTPSFTGLVTEIDDEVSLMCLGTDDRNGMGVCFTDRESPPGTEDHHESFAGPNGSTLGFILSLWSGREVARL
jgi:hypothetical protein